LRDSLPSSLFAFFDKAPQSAQDVACALQLGDAMQVEARAWRWDQHPERELRDTRGKAAPLGADEDGG